MEKTQQKFPENGQFPPNIGKNTENFNLKFQKLAKSNQESQKLGKNDNLNYFPTASPKSYWELGSQVPIQFARLLISPIFEVEKCPFFTNRSECCQNLIWYYY